jgi:hypothetical protein
MEIDAIYLVPNATVHERHKSQQHYLYKPSSVKQVDKM